LEEVAVNVVFMLLALSVVSGLAIGSAFSWFAILICAAILVMLSAAVLQTAGFGAVEGIAVIAACLTVNRAAYLIGLMSRGSLIREQANEKPSQGRDTGIGRKNQPKQRTPSWFA
jgi:hypothetical protein